MLNIYYPSLKVIWRISSDGRYKEFQRYIVPSSDSLTCLFHPGPLAFYGSISSGTWHQSHASNAEPEDYEMIQGLPACLPWVDGWETSKLLRIAQTPICHMPAKKPVLLEQPLMSVWASDISAKFGLAINRDSSRDLIFTGSLSPPACHFAVVRTSIKVAARF